MTLEHLFGQRIVTPGTQGFKRAHRDHATPDAFAILRLDLVNARDLLAERARADQAQQPGNLDLPVILLCRFIDARDHRQPGGRGLGLPHGFHRRQLGLLGLTHGVAGFVTQDDHAQA